MSIEDKEFVLEPETLRAEIKKEYSHVATNPEAEFHFHTGRRLANILEKADAPQKTSAAKFGTLGVTFMARKP